MYIYFKLAPTIALTSTTAPMVANGFMSYWVSLYDIPDYLLTNNGSQFIKNISDIVCAAFETTHITRTSYHHHSDDQTESYSKTLVLRLCHSVSEHQTDSEQFI